jgi:hypothetical protein
MNTWNTTWDIAFLKARTKAIKEGKIDPKERGWL